MTSAEDALSPQRLPFSPFAPQSSSLPSAPSLRASAEKLPLLASESHGVRVEDDFVPPAVSLYEAAELHLVDREKEKERAQPAPLDDIAASVDTTGDLWVTVFGPASSPSNSHRTSRLSSKRD